MEKMISVILDVNRLNKDVHICVAPTYTGSMRDLIIDAKLVISKNEKDHHSAAYKGIVKGPWWNVSDSLRRSLARGGHFLDILIKDKDAGVRAAVAECGYGLDILVHDKSEAVRAAVASKNYGLDILVHDKSFRVRKEVLFKNYGLDILVHDENAVIRRVAEKRLSATK